MEQAFSRVSAGFADIGANKLMPENALFSIASQSKLMTTTALTMLVNEGKVDADAPVESICRNHRTATLSENFRGHFGSEP